MQILWCGGEGLDFVNGVPVVDYWASGFRSDWARFALQPPRDSYCMRGTPFWDGAVTSCWASCRVYQGSSDNDQMLLGLGYSGDNMNSGLWVTHGDTSYSYLTLCKYTGWTRTILAVESPNSWFTGSIRHLVMQVINYGASGTVNVYNNGDLVINYTGDLTSSGVSSLDTLMFAGRVSYHRFSEFMVTDSNPMTLNLRTHYITGAGDSNSWTGAYTDIDDDYEDQSDNLNTDSDAQDAQFALADLPAGDYFPWGVKFAALACSPDGSTANTLSLGAKSGGSIDAGSDQLMTLSPQTYERWVTSLNGQQITPAVINAMQLNLRSGVYSS